MNALQIVDFRYLLVARVFVSLAAQIQGMAVGWQVYELTKDPLSLGLVGLTEVVPSIAVGLYAGHITDVTERRHIAMGAVVMLLLSFSGLAFVSLAHPSRDLYVGLIFLFVALGGVGRGFYRPVGFALLGQIMPRNLLGNASAWNTTIWQTAAIGGPILGGWLYIQIGAATTYGFCCSLLLISMVMFYLIRSRSEKKEDSGSVIESIKEGLSFVFANQIILGAMCLDMFAVLLGGAVALLPIFADKIFHGGPEALGMLRASPSIGAFIMAALLTRHPVRHRAGGIFLLSVAAFGLCIIGFGLSRNLYLSVFLLALSGAFDAISIYVRATIYQLHTPENMKGRVASVNSIFIASSNEIGQFESGVVAKFLGVIPSVIFGGCATLVVVALTALKAPKLRKLDLE
jgi:MFS family permease